MAPAWRLLYVSRRVILDLTWASTRPALQIGFMVLLFLMYLGGQFLTCYAGGTEPKEPTKESDRAVLMRRACARTPRPRNFLLLEHSF